MKATAIIGAGFGDEGKGLMTDYIAASSENPVVVRFSGGAQAGHTVVLPDGRRHVHGHFGSGTLAKVPTFLGPKFVVSPIHFNRELEELHALRIEPNVYVDNDCRVTTPFDIYLNQALEMSRGDGKHGSCGVGFGETIERSNRPSYGLYVEDLQHAALRSMLIDIQRRYLPERLRELGLNRVDPNLLSIGVVDTFMKDCERFVENISRTDPVICRAADHIIFEGAQGLLLDQDSKYFPHVTRSKTGLDYVMDLVGDMGVKELDVIYVTRAYRTRHGAGPMRYEEKAPPYKGISDNTNIDGQWQGPLRYGYLDVDEMRRAIDADFHRAHRVLISKHLAITCLDQVGDRVLYMKNSGMKVAPTDVACYGIHRYVGADRLYTSNGPTRKDVSIKEGVLYADQPLRT